MITADYIQKQIDRADATDPADGYNGAANDLISIDEDLRTTDQRARDGLGFGRPLYIEPAARQLLNEWLSRN